MNKRLLLIAMILGIFATLFGSATPSQAQGGDPPQADLMTLQRITDIYAGSSNSFPSGFAIYNGSLYFSANNNNGFGQELWKYDPINGAVRVASFANDLIGVAPSYLTVYEGSLYFTANGNDGTGRELWKYDYAANQAALVADIYGGPTGSEVSYITVYNGALYFAASGDDGAGYELWKYDTVNGASRVADIYSGSTSSFPYYMAVYNGALYFTADGNDGAGSELWKYDPTNGVVRVEDIYVGSGSSYPYHKVVYNGALYFWANGNDGAGHELWKYDVANGTQRVVDIYEGANSSGVGKLAVYNGSLYFAANGNDGVGKELWKYDPINGADRVADVYGGPIGADIAELTVYDNALYFAANGNDDAGQEMWRFNNSITSAFRSAPAYDGWTLEAGETTNVGGTINASASTFYIGDNAQNKQYRSILSFDTSTLPENAVITRVTLKIRKQGLAGANPFTTHGALTVDIIKGAFGANIDLQAGDFQAAVSKSAVGAIPQAAGNWFSRTWTSSIASYINKSGDTQFRLRFATDDNNDNGADYLKFFSGNATDITLRPLLEIMYYTP